MHPPSVLRALDRGEIRARHGGGHNFGTSCPRTPASNDVRRDFEVGTEPVGDGAPEVVKVVVRPVGGFVIRVGLGSPAPMIGPKVFTSTSAPRVFSTMAMPALSVEPSQRRRRILAGGP